MQYQKKKKEKLFFQFMESFLFFIPGGFSFRASVRVDLLQNLLAGERRETNLSHSRQSIA